MVWGVRGRSPGRVGQHCGRAGLAHHERPGAAGCWAQGEGGGVGASSQGWQRRRAGWQCVDALPLTSMTQLHCHSSARPSCSLIPLVLFPLEARHPLPLPPDPQVIAVLIGTNNELDSRPAAKLHVLLTWLERAYPASQLLVIPPPPSWQRRYIQLRDAYGAMLRAHPRVFFSLCGAGLDPSSFDDMKDGVRPGRRVWGEALGGGGQDGGWCTLQRCLNLTVPRGPWRRCTRCLLDTTSCCGA